MTTNENLKLEEFSNLEFGQIRILAESGKYLFCASDAKTALGYSNPRSALQRHCKGVVKRDPLTPGCGDEGGKAQNDFVITAVDCPNTRTSAKKIQVPKRKFEPIPCEDYSEEIVIPKLPHQAP